VSEERIAIADIMQAGKDGRLTEAFGTGTAAVISPVGELNYGGETVEINRGVIGPVAQKLYDTLTGIQYGRIDDPFGWSVEI
jgi:branched-chain amino acid aminotransferase